MKKILFITAFILILLIFVLCGCQDVKTTAPETTDSHDIGTVPSDLTSDTAAVTNDPSIKEPDDIVSDPPAPGPRFTSGEDYEKLKGMLAHTDGELEDPDLELAIYLDSYLSYVKGDTTRERIETLLAAVRTISPYLPRLPDSMLTFASLELFSDIRYGSLVYQVNGGGRYLISLVPEARITIDTAEQKPVCQDQKIGEYQFDLYEYTHVGGKLFWFGSFRMGDYTVEIMADPPTKQEQLDFSKFYFVNNETD